MISSNHLRNLLLAGNYYTKNGYKELEVPWHASNRAIATTTDKSTILSLSSPHAMQSREIHLVGSAEQSFIDMMLQDKLEPGKYWAITPCFRWEPSYNKVHTPYFMKLELLWIPNSKDVKENLHTMIKEAADLMASLKLPLSSLEKICTSFKKDTWDLELNGFEVGSYGARTMSRLTLDSNCNHVEQELTYLYGTGLAEPRFTYANSQILDV